MMSVPRRAMAQVENGTRSPAHTAASARQETSVPLTVQYEQHRPPALRRHLAQVENGTWSHPRFRALA